MPTILNQLIPLNSRWRLLKKYTLDKNIVKLNISLQIQLEEDLLY